MTQSNIGLGKLTQTRDGKDKKDDLAQYTDDIASDVEEAYYSAYQSALGHTHQHHSGDNVNKEEDSSSSAASPRSTLASLPSSFTTLLLSLLDSPAYANLTSAYLTSVFNPSTPDDPSVKYFSVAGRVSGMSVWHPLWLPKMVLDRYEEKQREKGLGGGPRWQWGNDGLVTVESARWGEFLGVLEGCDHWTIRGARGIEVDLPSVSVPGLRLGLSSGTGGGVNGGEEDEKAAGDGWSLTDWSRFAKAWKKEEKDSGVGLKMAESGSEGASAESGRWRRPAIPEQADEVLKSSTDKLSAVFDWIAEQVPSPRSLPIPGLSSSPPSTSSDGVHEGTVRKQSEHSDLASKDDLERFYVALCRKLYDEGL